MSVHVMSWVWRQPIKDDGKFRLLLSIADMVDDDGVGLPTPIAQLMERCGGASRSTVQRRIKQLTDDGYLSVEAHFDENGARTSNVYRVVMDGVQTTLDPQVILDSAPGSKTPGSRQGLDLGLGLDLDRKEGGSPGRKPRPRDLAFETLVEVTGSNVAVERGKLNRALAGIRTAAAADGERTDEELSDEIRRRAELWPGLFPEAVLTATALAAHWVRLGGTTTVSRFRRRLGGLTPEEVLAMGDEA